MECQNQVIKAALRKIIDLCPEVQYLELLDGIAWLIHILPYHTTGTSSNFLVFKLIVLLTTIYKFQTLYKVEFKAGIEEFKLQIEAEVGL